MNKIFLLLAFLLLSGCLTPPEAKFNLDQSDKLDFNPLSFEALKLWNRTNLTTQEVQLDACNKAIRLGSYSWQISLKNC